ncbi:MAG: hypothetical protein ACK5RR_00065, partial [Acidobacteriota bacterium]
VAHWAAARTGQLTVNSLAMTARRQVGMFRPLETIQEEEQTRIVHEVCAGCVGDPLWVGESQADCLACPEPCNHWLSAALERQV